MSSGPVRKMTWGTVAALLAVGWGFREAQFASAQGKRIANSTINVSEVKAAPATHEGQEIGKARVFLDGETPTTRSLQVGRLTLNPGAEPHPPHRHADEEILVFTKGTGDVLCDGKKVTIKPGAVMYADPNVEHGIKNTGTTPMEFYWIKYVGK